MNLNESQILFYTPPTPTSLHSTVGHRPLDGDSPSQSMTSSASSASSVQACKALLLQKQKSLAALKGSGTLYSKYF